MDATDILQNHLDRVSMTILQGDWPTYRDGVHLPFHIVSHDESKVVTTEEDLRAGFDQFRATLRSQKVTDFIRLVGAATRLDQDLISGSYLSHLVSHGQRVIQPFRSQMSLRLIGNRWRAVSVTNELANSRWPLVRLQLHPDDDEGPKE